MNKVYHISDLHLEFLSVDQVHKVSNSIAAQLTEKKSILVLAGDISPLLSDVWERASRLSILLDAVCSKVSYVVYSFGNHEFYGTYKTLNAKGLLNCDVESIISEHEHAVNYLQSIYPNLVTSSFSDKPSYIRWVNESSDILVVNLLDWYTLRKDWIIQPKIADCKAICDLELYEELSCRLASIRDSQLEGTYALHKNKETKLILVGHFLPVQECVASQYKNSPLNNYFVADKGQLLRKLKLNYYIHGHTHTPVDVDYAGVRILANPYGYPSENLYQQPLVQSFKL